MLAEITSQEQPSTILEGENNSDIDGITASVPTRKYKYIMIRYHHAQQLARDNFMNPIHKLFVELTRIPSPNHSTANASNHTEKALMLHMLMMCQ